MSKAVPKDISTEDRNKILSFAISVYNLNHHADDFTDEQLIALCNCADPDLFSDRLIADNEVIRNNFQWHKMGVKRQCRLMARLMDIGHVNILDNIRSKLPSVRISDIKPILMREPMMIKGFNIDMERISDSDAYILLEMGKDYFLKNVTTKGRKFSMLQQYNICKAYNYDRNVLIMFNCKAFDGFYTKKILEATAHLNLDLLDLDNMKLIDWIDLLSVHPDLYERCNMKKFSNAPIMELIDIAVMFDDNEVYATILERDLREVSPYGWEKLMKHKSELFAAVCDHEKWNEAIKKSRP